MNKIDLFFAEQLEKRGNLKRKLQLKSGLIDFSSNDYLGLAKNAALEKLVLEQLSQHHAWLGSTGSRLLTGNSIYFEELEEKLRLFFHAEACLFFNSGYSANASLIATVCKKGDLILYDELIHASLKEGYRLSFADKTSFRHNQLEDLESKLKKNNLHQGNIFVLTESVFSMDGDSPDLIEICNLCEKYNAYLVLDEAHGTGIFGEKGEGLAVALALEDKIFARVHTFGKAFGGAGACVLGSKLLKEYLVNFGLGFIYTTASQPLLAIQISATIDFLQQNLFLIRQIKARITFFKQLCKAFKLEICAQSESAIQMLACKNETQAIKFSTDLAQKGFDVRPILPPTAKEARLRICLHAHNSEEDIKRLIHEIIFLAQI